MSSARNRLPRWRSFLYGLSLPGQALRLIFTKPSLLLWSLIPICITLSLYTFLILRLQMFASESLKSLFIQWGLDATGWSMTLAVVLTQVVLFLGSALTFSLVASILACPFNDFLAERAERFAIPPLAAVPSPLLTFRIRLLLIDAAKSIAATTAGIVVIFVSWVPVVGFLTLLLTWLLFCFQFISYPQTRRGHGLWDGFRFLWKYSYACAGFGAVLAFFFAIPIVSSFSLPLAVVGGTLLFARAPGTKELPGLR